MVKIKKVKAETKSIYEIIPNSNKVRIDGNTYCLDIMTYENMTNEKIEQHIIRR